MKLLSASTFVYFVSINSKCSTTQGDKPMISSKEGDNDKVQPRNSYLQVVIINANAFYAVSFIALFFLLLISNPKSLDVKIKCLCSYYKLP